MDKRSKEKKNLKRINKGSITLTMWIEKNGSGLTTQVKGETAHIIRGLSRFLMNKDNREIVEPAMEIVEKNNLRDLYIKIKSDYEMLKVFEKRERTLSKFLLFAQVAVLALMIAAAIKG